MVRKILKYIEYLAVLIVLIGFLVIVKDKVGNKFETKVARYSAESSLGSSSINWGCVANTSECARDQVKITHKSNDIELLCFEIFNPNSPLRKLVKGEYQLTLPLPEIVNEVLPEKNDSFEKTELYQQCIAAASAAENSVVARVTGPGLFFELKNDKRGMVKATTVLTNRFVSNLI